ncbi:MAG: thiamine diphosphokinase [Ruminococcaceae bacterium]|nr:thiamine diphosphokinase [Oscillospiraceae bacterium]
MRAVIISNGIIENYEYFKRKIKEDDFVICADGAIKHCINMHVVPNLWIGDFDSCDNEEYTQKYSYLKSVPVISLNPQKDETDTHYACNVAIEKGCTDILIIGALGKRMDHAISNIGLLEHLLSRGINGRIEDEHNTISVFSDTYISEADRKYISLIPLDKEVNVKKTDGLLYPLENHIMKRGYSLGISNEKKKNSIVITLTSGTMLVIESED